jgi:hypothetical protein
MSNRSQCRRIFVSRVVRSSAGSLIIAAFAFAALALAPSALAGDDDADYRFDVELLRRANQNLQMDVRVWAPDGRLVLSDLASTAGDQPIEIRSRFGSHSFQILVTPHQQVTRRHQPSATVTKRLRT